MDHWFTWTFTQVIFVEMLNWLIDELAFVELVICLTDFCSAQIWWNLHFDELTFDELTFCSVGFDQFSLLNFSCLVDMEPFLRFEFEFEWSVNEHAYSLSLHLASITIDTKKLEEISALKHIQ